MQGTRSSDAGVFPLHTKNGPTASLMTARPGEGRLSNELYALLNDQTVSVRLTKGPSVRKIHRSNPQFPDLATRYLARQGCAPKMVREYRR
jgi:hypothetical protein